MRRYLNELMLGCIRVLGGKKMFCPSEIKSEPMWNFLIGQEHLILFKIKTKVERVMCVGGLQAVSVSSIRVKGLHSQIPGKVH